MLGTSFDFGCIVPVNFKCVSPQNGLQLSIFGINTDPIQSMFFPMGSNSQVENLYLVHEKLEFLC